MIRLLSHKHCAKRKHVAVLPLNQAHGRHVLRCNSSQANNSVMLARHSRCQGLPQPIGRHQPDSAFHALHWGKCWPPQECSACAAAPPQLCRRHGSELRGAAQRGAADLLTRYCSGTVCVRLPGALQLSASSMLQTAAVKLKGRACRAAEANNTTPARCSRSS